MNYVLDFFLTLLGGGLGAFGGVTLARHFYRKKDAAEHDRQMADWDMRLKWLRDFNRRREQRDIRLHTPN